MKRLPLSLLATASLLTSATATSVATPRGDALRVGSAQTYTSIQDAIDVASTGDLIYVDPGTYSEFHIDGKGIAVVASGANFDVLESTSSAPAILIENIAAPDQVSIIGAHIEHGISTRTAAVEVRNNSGAIRFSLLEIAYTGDMLGTPARGALEISATDTFWLIDSEAWPMSARQAFSTSGSGFREAVSAVVIDTSDGVIQNCRLRGYDAGQSWGGDGVRILGASSVWIVDDVVLSPTATILRGGDGTFGGSALQYVGTKVGSNRNTICGRVQLNAGNGTTQDGGLYSLNGDLGVTKPGPFPGLRLPTGCRNFEYAQTSVTLSTVGIGQTVTFKLWSLVGGPYVMAISDGTLYTRNFYNVNSRCMIRLNAPQSRIIFSGTLLPAIAQTIQLKVPNQLSLIGTQATFQTITGIARTQTDALTFPAMIVVTP